ncbi:Protein of uncharacterised function (DUF1480) [Providencia rustigianii]|uniref:Uncharacterized protein n=2 Tax=Providencia rustigianii TaxID=158850 RepID=D1P4W7_9GAMM|nr:MULTISPECIES: DUF1480 family protein [Providencia]EFB71531.1 hypothetical protein PROVRUST_07271 [Providencia rustigianii DSM 4541]MTC57626.1 DUF1480 family protein [Providencia rustigianii]MTC59138.1 DUF1480 family protein [Providencia rustigianii]SUC27231.1 Protein of uncharacterised function (DUF1480) [Providencia rustigianii]SUC35707.1 Protein of uncharacterised function (DUF1480) [Providencia rustigianii]
MCIVKLKISSYEINDAVMPEKYHDTLSIPCDSDSEFCMQLDGWDEHTSIPATIDEKPVLLYRQRYDKENHHWVMRVA